MFGRLNVYAKADRVLLLKLKLTLSPEVYTEAFGQLKPLASLPLKQG
jgi:hypothetical protein